VRDILFGEGEDPSGQMIRVRNQPFKVVGVMTRKGQAAMGEDQDDSIYVPYTAVMKKLQRTTFIQNITVSAESAGQIKKVADVLEMTVEEAYDFFQPIPRIRAKLQTLMDVGLDYITLGQSATTLSGGEAQRVKLARELSKRNTGRTLYLLDEPTTGLHFDDTKRLIQVLNSLVEKGNTVYLIEHNLDVIKSADHIIDIGPEGGDAGGYIIAEGAPESVAETYASYTGRFLKNILIRT
jgi:excinuclease UvrABC ATPase subunit